MRRIILSILVLCAIYSTGEILYQHFVVFPKKRASKKTRRWEDMDPPARYADYCKRKELQWTISWQTDFRNGDLKEVWEVNEKGDSILTRLYYSKIWSDDSELNYIERSKLKRQRELAKEQWSEIIEKAKSEKIKINNKVLKYSPK